MTRSRSLFLPNKPILTLKEFEKVLGIALTYITSMSYIKLKALFYLLFYTGVPQPMLLKLTRKEIGEKRAKGEWQLNKNVIKIFNQYYRTEPEEHNAFNVTPHTLAQVFRNVSRYYGFNVSVEVFRKSFVERSKLNEKEGLQNQENQRIDEAT